MTTQQKTAIKTEIVQGKCEQTYEKLSKNIEEFVELSEEYLVSIVI